MLEVPMAQGHTSAFCRLRTVREEERQSNVICAQESAMTFISVLSSSRKFRWLAIDGQGLAHRWSDAVG